MEQEARIIRAKHGKENPYFLHLRATAQDSALSFEARGMLSYLLSKGDTWEIQPADLQREGGIGRDKTNRILNELIEQQYLVREHVRKADGTFSSITYTLYESPHTENPYTDNPNTANPQHIEYKSNALESTESCGTEDATEPDSDEKLSTTTRKPRKRSAKQLELDNMINAIADAFGLDRATVTNVKWGEFRKAGRELIDAGATPEDMKPLHAHCAKKVSEFSSVYMAKEWSEFATKRSAVRSSNPYQLPPEPEQEYIPPAVMPTPRFNADGTPISVSV